MPWGTVGIEAIGEQRLGLRCISEQAKFLLQLRPNLSGFVRVTVCAREEPKSYGAKSRVESLASVYSSSKKMMYCLCNIPIPVPVPEYLRYRGYWVRTLGHEMRKQFIWLFLPIRVSMSECWQWKGVSGTSSLWKWGFKIMHIMHILDKWVTPCLISCKVTLIPGPSPHYHWYQR
jgi:hypothetical protein